jgi:hypothetical protein
MADEFAGYPELMSDPADSLAAVVLNDGADLPRVPKALWVGVLGDVSVIAKDDADPVVLKGVQGLLPVRARRVRATGTTATDIVALY